MAATCATSEIELMGPSEQRHLYLSLNELLFFENESRGHQKPVHVLAPPTPRRPLRKVAWAAGFSSYDGDLSLPLGLALGSPTGWEGRPGASLALAPRISARLGAELELRRSGSSLGPSQ